MRALLSRWRLWLAASGVCVLVGGPLHPAPDTHLSFRLSTARMLSSGQWVLAHALILVGFVLLVAGLAGLLHSGVLSDAAMVPARVALAGASLSVIEMAFHLSAVTERHALAAGRGAPIVDIHMGLAVIAYPILGLAVAGVAVIESGRLGVAWRVASILGALGAVAHGLSAPIVVLSRDQHFSPLFKGAGVMAIWFVLLAAVAARLASTPTADHQAVARSMALAGHE